MLICYGLSLLFLSAFQGGYIFFTLYARRRWSIQQLSGTYLVPSYAGGLLRLARVFLFLVNNQVPSS